MKLTAVFRKAELLFSRKQYLFVLSHMRSHSTVLCHILGSHPEINGYSEIHQRYLWWPDLIRLRWSVSETTEGRLDGRFILDKVLYNYHRISDSILKKQNFLAIILLRKPEETLRSIIHNAKSPDGGNKSQTEPVTACDYYVKRLNQLVVYSKKLGERGLFIESEKLIEDTAHTLTGITKHLDLTQPLSAEYSRFKFTGAPRYGDRSELIHTGRITKSHHDYSDISIPESLLETAWATYQQSKSIIVNHSALLNYPVAGK